MEDAKFVEITKTLDNEVTPLVAKANALPMETLEDVESASVFLKELATARKNTESQRTFFTKPMNDQLSKINKFFKQYSEPIVLAEKTLKARILEYTASHEAPNTIGNATQVTKTKWEVVDITKVPKEYLITTIDETKVEAAVNILGIKKIAGLNIYEDKTIRTK